MRGAVRSRVFEGRPPAQAAGRAAQHAEGPPAEVFVCAVRVDDGFCDRYRVERDGAEFTVRVLERRASCVLPVG